MALPKKLKDAETAMLHFENEGRTISGLSILKDGYRLDFATTSQEASNDPAGLVNMGEK